MGDSVKKAPRVIRRGRPSLEQAERLADDIMDHAIELFMVQGFDATSVEAIAAAAGISKRTYYTRFAGKAEVFEAVILRYVERNVRIEADPGASELPLVERLYEMATHFLGWILQPDILALYRMTIAEVPRFPDLARMVVDYAIADSARSFEPVFREHAGRPISDEEVAFIAGQFMQAVGADPFHRAIQGLDVSGLSDEKRTRVRQAVELFLRGFP